jgi:ribonucleoside-diphosphate reductase alpha chain
VHYLAWKLGCKGLYYLRTETTQRAENVAEKIKRDKLKDFVAQEDESCVACEG